jgi:hypothetical protein
MISVEIGWRAITSIAKPRVIMRREGFGLRGITDSGKNNDLESVNPVRRVSAFKREGSNGALNPVFALKGFLYPSPLQAPLEIVY